jgi:hypothetical protein
MVVFGMNEFVKGFDVRGRGAATSAYDSEFGLI